MSSKSPAPEIERGRASHNGGAPVDSAGLYVRLSGLTGVAIAIETGHPGQAEKPDVHEGALTV
jgi:hypothetical protein